MISNIPIYRAKKIDSNKYVDGYYFHQEWTGNYPNEDAEEREEEIKHFICGFTTHDIWDDEEGYFKFMGLNEIDSTTLAIHFPDMLDSQGNKIFASLQKDGKGGDILLEESRLNCTLKIEDSSFREFTAIHTINGNRFVNEKILSDIGDYRDKHFKGYDVMIYDFFMMKKRNIKVIGIQE